MQECPSKSPWSENWDLLAGRHEAPLEVAITWSPGSSATQARLEHTANRKMIYGPHTATSSAPHHHLSGDILRLQP